MFARYAVLLLVVVQQVYGPACDNFLTCCDSWVSACCCFDQRRGYFMTDATTARSMSMWSLINATLLGLERTLAAPDAEPRRRQHHYDRWRHDFGFPDILFDILFGFELFSMIGVRRPPCASPAALHATGRVLSARVCLHRGGQCEYYDYLT